MHFRRIVNKLFRYSLSIERTTNVLSTSSELISGVYAILILANINSWGSIKAMEVQLYLPGPSSES